MPIGKILVVDDDQNICELLRLYIEKEGFEVAIANDGRKALEAFDVESPDLIMLDIMLPELDGWQVCREIRKKSQCPIIMLTAKGEVFDKVLGLELGADDYVVKPFQFEELEARLNALLRRSSGFTQASIEAGALRLDLNRKQATVNDEPLALTAFEYRILEYLMRHQQQVVAKERLMEQLYPDDEERDANVIEVLVGRLRRKLEAQGNLRPIETVRGIGYLFTERCR